MGDSITKIRNQFNEYFQSLNTKQKTLIGLGSFFLVLTLGLAIFSLTRPQYVTLYSGLPLDESGKITQKLTEMNISYETENGGTAITVPEKDLNKARMDLAIEGFPQSGMTWEDAFSSNSLTMTNDDKQKKYLQVQMSQLARTIEEIKGIEKASVLLTVPDNSNFLTEDIKKSKASVLLTPRSGFRLSEQQVNGIVTLVANAVEGLELNNVSIHDNTGTMLNDSFVDSEGYSMNKKMDMQQEVTQSLSNSLREFLSKIYGAENVDIMLNVTLDFDREVTDIKEFTTPNEGESGLVRSFQELKEEVQNNNVGGVPGTDSNSDEITQYNEIDSDDSSYSKENKSVNYELNEIRKSIVKESGNIKDITVAIILNRSTLENGELTDDHKSRLIRLVSAAAGLETKKVEVMARDFNNASGENLLAISSEDPAGFTANIPFVSIGIISLLFVVGIVFAALRIRRRRIEMKEILDESASGIDEDVEEIDIDMNDRSSYKYQIEKFVDKKPDSVAQLLRSWLNED